MQGLEAIKDIQSILYKSFKYYESFPFLCDKNNKDQLFNY